MFTERQRRAKRLPLQLPIKVEARNDPDIVESDVTRLISVSSLGAGFCLQRAFGIGRLLMLTIPMPPKLRNYDHLEAQYKVWGIVRHCDLGPDGNYIGVAFIGDKPPRSYFENPLKRYRIQGVGSDELWRIVEDDDSRQERRQQRYSIPINVSLAVYDDADQIVAHERTVTENISVGGAAVFSSLPLKTGDLVKVISDQYNVALTAEVRNIRMGADGLPRAHLKFNDGAFPLEGIEQV